jgi:pimeloyl-ACP methyl ester carboxylesterase
MVEESHSSNDDSTLEQHPMEPRLRGLYTPPPTQVVADNSTHEDGWITEVTNGTIITGPDGSPHILYYEVHHRSYYRNMSSSSTTTSTTTEKKQGLTALFLHGGPGASCNANHVRFFNPQYYETVVLLDQRGCGRSVPLGEVSYNTLELLVEDIEQLRHVIFSSSSSSNNNNEHESIKTTRPWDTIVGGSWGCTLAMAYAHTYPTNVRSLVLRGVCMFRTKEINWLFGDPPPLYNGDNNNTNNNHGMRSTTANLRLLLEGDSERGKRSDTTSSLTTAATNNNNVITRGTTATTIRTAAEVFPTGWDEFRKGANILRPRSPFSKQQRTNANQPTTTITSRRDTLHKYYNLILGSTDPNVRNDAVKSWLRWEMGIYSSGFCNIRGPTTTTTSNRAAHQDDDEVKKNYNNNNNTVLVYYPSTSSWSYEDTRVWTNDSFVSIGTYNNNEMREQPDEMANSLRRFSTSSSCTTSSTTSSLGLASLDDDGILRPLPFDSMDATTSPSGKNNSTTPTPTTYIPAQSMLTVFYSANDDYCIGRYKSFLSMERQQPHQLSDDNTANESSKSSWFSSALPPEMPVLTTLSNKQFSKNPVSSSTKSSTTTTSSFPLPPTIAIQGGNDAICPPDTALDLHEVWKEMELRIVLQSGHSMYDPLIAGEIVKALDRFGYSLIDT